jgi:CHAT domain-containing protein
LIEVKPFRAPFTQLAMGPRYLYEVLNPLLKELNKEDFRCALVDSPQLAQNVISTLQTICNDEADVIRMIDFTEAMLRWYPLAGYFLAYYLQLVTQARSLDADTSTIFSALAHLRACILFSDADINLNNDDQAFLSAEVAYHDFLLLKNELQKHPPTHDWEVIQDDLNNYERVIVGRLKVFYSFYSRWCRPFGPMECNPLTDNLYFRFTSDILALEFPELDFYNKDGREAALIEVINKCDSTDFLYYRVLARRFLAAWYLGGYGKQTTGAIEQLSLGLQEAASLQLDAEIGHLLRLLGYAFAKSLKLQEATDCFYEAYKGENSLLLLYWRSLTARELASVLRIGFVFNLDLSKFPADVRDPSKACLAFYRSGRTLFDMASGDTRHLPISTAVHQQMFRSYSENAIDQARVMESISDVVGEIESNGPREIVSIVAEMQGARDLPASSAAELRKATEAFHRHLTTMPETFEEYLTSFPQQYASRHDYYANRQRTPDLKLKIIPTVTASTVEEALSTRLPRTHFLFFNVGRVSTIASIDMENGKGTADLANFAERELEDIHHEYQEMLQDTTLGAVSERVMQKAIDLLLTRYEEFLVPLLKPILAEVDGGHLKIFPRLQMNEVPLHALKIGKKRLLNYCDVSYNQNLSLFLKLHTTNNHHRKLPPLVAYNEEGTQGLLNGSINTIKRDYEAEPTVLIDSNWQELHTAIAKSQATDVFFACHGHYDPYKPVTSYLRLSNTHTVSFPNIFSDVDLSRYRSVVLGACQSGLVKTELAAEYVGLPSSFLAAGVRYFVGTLWKVNELATSILLSKYFASLSDGTCSLPAALNLAQRQLMTMTRKDVRTWVNLNIPQFAPEICVALKQMKNKPFSHPYYWASFYISGDV